jgi:hypothetical protein
MISKDYFEGLHVDKIKALSPDGKQVAAYLFLHDGRMFLIHDIVSVHEDFVILTVYPPELEKVKADHHLAEEIEARTVEGSKKMLHDILVIPYSSIDHLRLTRRQPSKKISVGFRADS